MDWYLYLIQKFSYLAILLGTLVEGEIFLVLGGLFARQGLMNVWIVIIMAIAGSFISHGLMFWLGRWRGLAVVQRFPKLQGNYPKAHALAERFGPACILIVQFLYGMRLVTCLVLGTLQLRVRAFVLWQLFACSLWALGMAAAGYACGTAIQHLISHLEVLLTVVVAIVLLLIGLYRWFWCWTERQICQQAAPERGCCQHRVRAADHTPLPPYQCSPLKPPPASRSPEKTVDFP